MFTRTPLVALVMLAAAPAAVTLAAQVSVTPRTVEPTDLVRFAVLAANPQDAAVVAVRVEVPEALGIIGVDAPAGWSARLTPASDSTPQAIEWTGGELAHGGFREFAFFARLGAGASRDLLVFPVRLSRADGSVREWRPGGEGAAPVVQIRGSVGVTAGGAFTLAAAAAGAAILALALALRRPR